MTTRDGLTMLVGYSGSTSNGVDIYAFQVGADHFALSRDEAMKLAEMILDSVMKTAQERREEPQQPLTAKPNPDRTEVDDQIPDDELYCPKCQREYRYHPPEPCPICTPKD